MHVQDRRSDSVSLTRTGGANNPARFLLKATEFNPWHGTKTTYRVEGDTLTVRKRYDAEPFLKAAAEERAATRGEQWGDWRKVASIPMAEYGRMLATGMAYDEKAIDRWLRDNHKLVTFEKYLK